MTYSQWNQTSTNNKFPNRTSTFLSAQNDGGGGGGRYLFNSIDLVTHLTDVKILTVLKEFQITTIISNCLKYPKK
jgi:hypothetical protein